MLDLFGVTDDEFDKLVAMTPGATEPASAGRANNDEVMNWLYDGNRVLSGEPDSRGFYEIDCPWAANHTDGEVTAGFSPLGCGGRDHEMGRQFSCLHEHCKNRTITDVNIEMFHERFIYGIKDNTIYDTMMPNVGMPPTHFNTRMMPFRVYKDDKAAPLSRMWMMSPQRTDVMKEGFYPHPDISGAYEDAAGEKMFNTFMPYTPFHAPTTGEDLLTPIFEQLRYLFGSEYDNALGFLGYTIHRPWKRIPFALLHISDQYGTGRGWLKQLMNAMFVRKYHRAASFTNFIKGQYNEFLYQSLLVTFDEVYDRKERFDVGERLRELITEEQQEVNIKFGFKGVIDVHANMMFFSNHQNALSIPDSDRRFWAVLCDKPFRSREHFEELYTLLDDKAVVAQMFWYLKRHIESADCAFDPFGRAPITEWTDAIKFADDDETFHGPIRELLARYRGLGVNAIGRTQLLHDLRSNGADTPSPVAVGNTKQNHQLRAVLVDMGVTRSTSRKTTNNGREYVYFLGPRIVGPVKLDESLAVSMALASPVNNVRQL
jgi:hypothetical protein